MCLISSENLDMLTLANSANTSVDMLQRFYLAGASVEQNIEELHSMKKSKEKIVIIEEVTLGRWIPSKRGN
jgi:hypothetical protein